jgi:2-C-methyl-D-erythritol 2,4-cyclodiphosphate synthase
VTSRSGIGVDVHPLVTGRPLILAGFEVPFDRGLQGHSDGDVVTHSIIDALLGAAALGDIGIHFPASDPQYRGIASLKLLRSTVKLLEESQWRPVFVDATIVAEQPVLRPIIAGARGNLADALGLDRESVSLKATTTDGLGLVGRGEGIASLAIATIQRIA